MPDAKVAAARAKLMAKGGAARTGGQRRVRKAAPKAAGSDDKRLQTTLKRLNTNNIPGIEEANFFQADGNIMHFQRPKVQAAFPANTYVVTGTPQTKSIQELLPSILSQMGPESFQYLQKMASMAAAPAAAEAGEGDDEDLEVDFDAAAEGEKTEA